MNSVDPVPHQGRSSSYPHPMARISSWTRAPGIAAAALALSLGAAACGGSDAADETTSDGASESAASANGPVLDASVFSGEATTVDGASFDLGPLANQDLVVWFWAPW